MDFEKLCNEIMAVDDNMRSARIIGDKGKLVAGGMKGNLKALEDVKTDEKLFMDLALRVRMRREFDQEFGEIEFSMSYREKVIIMSFPMNEHILFASAEIKLKFDKVALKILKILQKHSS
jgi:hypothetical protein